MHVRAVVDIRAGEELTVHYVSLFEPRGMRQQQLLDGKFFSCRCARCVEPIARSADRFLEVGLAEKEAPPKELAACCPPLLLRTNAAL